MTLCWDTKMHGEVRSKAHYTHLFPVASFLPVAGLRHGVVMVKRVEINACRLEFIAPVFGQLDHDAPEMWNAPGRQPESQGVGEGLGLRQFHAVELCSLLNVGSLNSLSMNLVIRKKSEFDHGRPIVFFHQRCMAGIEIGQPEVFDAEETVAVFAFGARYIDLNAC